MRPHIISHILITVAGQVNSAELKIASACDEYEAIRKSFGGDAWLAGPAAMREYSDASQPLIYADQTPAGTQPVFVAMRAESYVIVADPIGQLSWSSNEIGDDHLICLLSQQVPQAYLRVLQQFGISYVVAGQDRIDIDTAFSELSSHFGIHTLLLKGESPVSRFAMQAGLVDEVSMLIAPALAQTRGTNVLGDDMVPVEDAPVSLKLKFVEKRNHDVLWVRYDVIRHDTKSTLTTKS